MAKGTAGKNYWALLLMILAGVVLGGFIGQLSAGVPALRWLNYGQTLVFPTHWYLIWEFWCSHLD